MKGNSMELNIQRFAEGGEGTSSGESAAIAQPQTSGAAENTSADNTSVAGEQNDRQMIDLSGYSEEQFEELIDKNPTLKKVFGKKVHNTIGRRLSQ